LVTEGMIRFSALSCRMICSSVNFCGLPSAVSAEDVVEGGTDFFVSSLLDGMGFLFSFGQRLGSPLQRIVDGAGARA